MSTASHHEEAIFEAALQIAPGQRADYLAKICGDDASLRRRLEILLAEHDQPEGALERSPAETLREAMGPISIPTEKPGDRIGSYKLLQQIGEGGCGVVWMAEQESPVRRRVALKIIKLGMDTRQVVARFEAERQALALMDHPNIAKVLDAGATQTGRPFFVMELVRGIRITDFCDQNQLSTEQRLASFTQVCQAVQHAHQKGIIHRDLKPSNILVADHDGVPVPKVIDFGIAKATTDQRLTDKTLFTSFEKFIGTPAYMSPEQANFSGLDVDTRTDIYSLGVLLYELLTGKTPFDAKELLQAGLDEMRRTIGEQEPARPSTRLSTMQAADLTTTAQHRHTEAPKLIHLLRGDLDWIVMKCLEKDRSRRYETANGLAMDVQRYLHNELVIARPPSAAYRFQKLVQRNRLAFTAAVMVTATILVAFVFLLFSNARTIRERNQKDIALQEKATALDAARMSEQRAKEELFTSLKNQARARRYSRQMGQRLDSFAAIAQAAQIRPDASLRDEAIAAMALPDVRRGPKWQVSRSNCVALACDAMGKRYAVLDSRGAVTVRRIEDNREIYRFEAGPACADCYADLAFSPDGDYLVNVGEAHPPFVWSLDTGEAILQNAPLGASTPAFSANQRFVAFADNQDVFCFDLATGREANHWRTLGRVHALQFHPTDDRIAVGFKEGPWLSVHDTTDGKEITRLEVGTGWRMIVSWHPAGRHVAVGSTALGIQVWDVQTQRRVACLESHPQETDFLSFHPSGNWLASWSWDEVVRLWEPMTEREVIQFPSAARLQFSRDGRWLGFFWAGNDQVQLLEFVAPPEYFTLQDHSGADRAAPKAAATSPDDRLLAVATADGVGLWDSSARREIARLPSGATDAIVFEADGRALWTCGRESGLQRWEVNRSGTNPPGFQPGPPQRVELPFTPLRFASDQSVRTLAVVNEEPGQAMVVDLATRTARVLPVPHPKASHVALSPNGKWLATSGWHSDRVQLWNLEGGALAQEWVAGLQTKIAFTPDNHELVVARGSEFNFLNVETLDTRRRLRRDIALYPGGVAFSPDGKLMAMEMAPAVIHLAEISTGRTVAQLADPFGDRPDAISFSRDGSKLITVSTYAAAVHIWDLHAVRSRLKAMGLDWDWPEFSQ